MAETLSAPFQMTVGYGRIEASWINNTAFWMSDYYPNPNPYYEALQRDRRDKALARRFGQYKLLAPQIEILVPGYEEVLDPFVEREITIGGAALRITTHLMPYVDPTCIRPIVELGVTAPDPVEVEHTLAVRDLKAGGSAIYDLFASAMTPSN